MDKKEYLSEIKNKKNAENRVRDFTMDDDYKYSLGLYVEFNTGSKVKNIVRKITMKKLTIDKNGNRFWFNEKGNRHRTRGILC